MSDEQDHPEWEAHATAVAEQQAQEWADLDEGGCEGDPCGYCGRPNPAPVPRPAEEPDRHECKWASSFLTQCHSVTVSAPEHRRLRCELVRAHDGPHRRERGMYDICWNDGTWVL